MNYYFFVASLPALSPEAPPPLTVEDFQAQCREHLSPSDAAAVDALLTGDRARMRGSFLHAWRQRETQLRNAIVRARAERLDRDASGFVDPDAETESAVERTVSDAYARPTPLERELALDRYRWSLAETMAGFNPFSIDAILAYAIKLQLLSRWHTWDERAGRKVAEAIIAQPAPA